ncbi:GGDEF domain-containing protein [Rhodococcus sp. 27YEA15]|uniref:GGDEF domain-containing protein n=1 Tax=Rhodococcus sp. 27YEA15 TaxID=3156259 RepID=UPI003C7C9E2E
MQVRVARIFLAASSVGYFLGVIPDALQPDVSKGNLTLGFVAMALWIAAWVTVLRKKPGPTAMAWYQFFAIAQAIVFLASMHEQDGQIASVVSFAFLAMYVRAFNPVRAGRLILGLMTLAVLAAVALSPTGLPYEMYFVFALVMIGAGEMFGMVTGHLISAATVDPLTGILNRAGWELAVAKLELPDENSENHIAVLALDVDNFKAINDIHGHHVGDEVLIDITRVLLAHVPESAVLARMGGDEFAICASVHRARSLESLRGDVSSWIPTVSVGISGVEPLESDVKAAHKRADLNLYEVKRARRKPHP